jgi:hypothetical protein
MRALLRFEARRFALNATILARHRDTAHACAWTVERTWLPGLTNWHEELPASPHKD